MSLGLRKAVVWRVQMTLPAVRMALKQCRSGGRKGWNCLRAAAPRDPLLQLSSIVSLSPDWHCENIHPGRYSVAANGSKQRAPKTKD